MIRRTDIPKPASTKKNRYNFDQFKPGDSTHAKDSAERSRIMTAFKYWAEHIKRIDGAYSTSVRVDETDPDGAGYRIWFMLKRPEKRAEQDEI